MRYVGNQVRFHPLIFQLILNRNPCRCGNIVYVHRQAIKLTIVADRYPIVQIPPSDFRNSRLYRLILPQPFRHKDENQNQHRDNTEPGSRKQTACDKHHHHFPENFIAGLSGLVEVIYDLSDNRMPPERAGLQLSAQGQHRDQRKGEKKGRR